MYVPLIFSHFSIISLSISCLSGAVISGFIQSARHIFSSFFVNGLQYVITWAELSVWPAPSAPHPLQTHSDTHFQAYTDTHSQVHTEIQIRRDYYYTHTSACSRTHAHMRTHKYRPPQLEVHSCCCLPCRDQKNILYSSPGENLPSHNKHKPSAQFEAPLWVVSVAVKAKVASSSPA